MNAENEFEILYRDEEKTEILEGAVRVIWGEIRSQLNGHADQTSPYLFHKQVDHTTDGFVMVKKNEPRQPPAKGQYLGLQKQMYADAIKTISTKSLVEKKQIALQLLGYQINESKEPLRAEHAATVVSMLLETLNIHSTEINSLRNKMAEAKGKKKLNLVEDKIENRLEAITRQKIWYGNIQDACKFILKKVKENELLDAEHRTYPVKGLDACKAFLDEYVFFDDDDYAVEKLHDSYRKMKN